MDQPITTPIADSDVVASLSELPGLVGAFVAPDSPGVSRVPEPWQPIARSSDPASRCATALARWNAEFCDKVPTFMAAFRAQLADVRVWLTDRGEHLLVYVVRDGDWQACWIGWDPWSAGPKPRFWEHFPGWLRAFLDEVHGGFTQPWGNSGPLSREDMLTLAEIADEPDGIPGWLDAWDDPAGRICSTRLVRIATNGGNLDYCLSPDLTPEQVALVYEGDIDPQDLASELDDLMSRDLDPERRVEPMRALTPDEARARQEQWDELRALMDNMPEARYAEAVYVTDEDDRR
ncbi:hypothetical protein [Plantactinospora sp. GCM10030261]|uniref:hypothetical protein n=1 Tax=Plantactinospora sp. GCM10030261 TaxID=3273420 RepID=UPI00361DA34A